jgi:hypothetical protein
VFTILLLATLRIEWPEREEVILPVVEGRVPRTGDEIENDHLIEATDSISLTSVTLGSLATLCGLYRGCTIDWKLAADLGVIHCTLGPQSGLLMPARPAVPSADDEQAEPR